MSNDMNNAITAAIGAHGMWKLRLGTAVNTGRMWTRSQDACRDDQCEFGHWLHGKTIDPQVKRGLPY